ncbi:MAG TPA: hypothetical protein VEB41_06920 [Burkholderiales bacterium]|nr:hypothetical protein [Usitatibacter sp.]HYD56622.1 hypothetical protein [Burkholderiales bacterium]
MRKQRAEFRRAKLPPILEIDEDGIPVNEMEAWNRQPWNSDEDTPGVSLGEWPTEFDD